MLRQTTGLLSAQRALLLGALLAFAGSAQANLLLVFNVEETRAGQEPSAGTVAGKLHVDIGADYFSYEDAAERVIYDFKSRRIHRLNLARKDYSDDSLFSDIGFRYLEFQNRLRLEGVLQEAGVRDNPAALSMSEHVFSIAAKDRKSGIQKKGTRDEVGFFQGDRKLAAYGKELLKADDAHRLGFVRFFRYHQSGHPELLRELASLKGIPQRYEIYKPEPADSTMVLTLETQTVTPPQDYTLQGFRKLPAGGELSGLISARPAYTAAKLRARAAEVLTAAEAAYAAGRHLDSILAYMEHHLITGEKQGSEFEAKRIKLSKDELVADMLASISPGNREEAQKAAPALVELRKKTLDRKHILMIFEANIRNSLGETDEAKQLFLRALAVNPYNVAAWRDLGELYFRSYDTRKAWHCWDLARTLLPSHTMLRTVDEYERNLLNSYPDFF